MSATPSQELFSLLRGIEEKSRAHAAGLPLQEEVRRQREVVLFTLLNTRFATFLDEVVEVLHMPSVITAVPGTSGWMRGVANIRGNLLPVIDLQSFLGGQSIVTSRRTRILVIKYQEGVTGLMVEEVLGMRHFPEEEQIDSPPPAGCEGAFVNSAFQQNGEVWPVFSMERLAESREFQVAAL